MRKAGRITVNARKRDLPARSRFPEMGRLNQKAVLPTVESCCTN